MKRKTDTPEPAKKPARKKTKAGPVDAVETWPEYFKDLFKVYKALNTVLAFVSSRKNMATTFPGIRASVESLMKQPLELSKVAEIKALLPDLVKFAYTPAQELQIHEETSSGRKKSPDFSAFQNSGSSSRKMDDDEHVLLLEFAENSKGKKSDHPANAYSLPPSLTPAALKKLVEKRNERFVVAVNELISAAPDSDDPVTLLKSAANAHIPIDPSAKKALMAGEDIKPHPTVPDSKNRPSIPEVIQELQEQSWYKDQIVDNRAFESRSGVPGALETPLSSTIAQALKESRNIEGLYTHQTAAINAIAQGRHVIVSTSTASGKSVIYQVPVLRFLEEDADSTALFIYPTKALAQDQKTALEKLLWACPGLQHIKVNTYDGDTPQELRRGIRDTASIIFTNFDMVHASILPHEELWRRVLKNLKVVAVDELHYYSNVFGSHVAQITRRLRRVCAAVGNRRIRFVSCSATISKPKAHMQAIFGIDDIEEITEDGAPSGHKTFLIWDTPYIDPAAPHLGRHSSLTEATGLMRFLMKRGVRVILFCKIRKVCELVMKTVRSELSAEGRLDIVDRVMSYRGGYAQEDRRKIEHRAFSGDLLGIVATNALELGVDIGVLDAVIMLGFPFGIANFRQQTGRAGRRARDSLAILVAEGSPVDGHFINNPDELFTKPADDLLIDLDSKIILEAHLQCAGMEMPLSSEDSVYFGPLMREVCESKLEKDKDGWYHTNPKFLPSPARFISLRGAIEQTYTVVDISKGQRIIEEVELSRALFEIYEGGVFINQGMTYIIKEVSHDSNIAKVIRADVNYTTTPRDFTNIDAVQTYRIRQFKHSTQQAFYGRIEIKSFVYGFFKIRQKAILDSIDLETAPYEREANGFWLDLSTSVLELMRWKGINPAEAIHAAQHAFLNRFPLANDLRTECKSPEKEYRSSESTRKRPARLVFYDSSSDGGVAAKAFDHAFEILSNAQRTVEACGCDEEGCNTCIHSAACRKGNEVSSKIGAVIILRSLLGLEIDENSIPFQLDGRAKFETVVEAPAVKPKDGVQIQVETTTI